MCEKSEIYVESRDQDVDFNMCRQWVLLSHTARHTPYN